MVRVVKALSVEVTLAVGSIPEAEVVVQKKWEQRSLSRRARAPEAFLRLLTCSHERQTRPRTTFHTPPRRFFWADGHAREDSQLIFISAGR